MIQIGWLVSDSLLILNLKTKIAINVAFNNTYSVFAFTVQLGWLE